MTQRIIQIGNSTGLIIPKVLLDKLGLEPGSEVILEENTETKSLTILKKGHKARKISVTPEFLTILDNVNETYGDALRELAQK